MSANNTGVSVTAPVLSTLKVIDLLIEKSLMKSTLLTEFLSVIGLEIGDFTS